VRFDMRGHGQSTVQPPGTPWDVGTLAGDVARVLDALGIAGVHFIGPSAGGMVGQQFAADHPGRVKSLVLLSAPPGMSHGDSDYDQWMETVRTKGHRGMLEEQARVRFNVDEVDPRQLAWSAAEAAKTPEWVFTSLVQYFRGLDLMPLLPGITAPTLIVGAERSPVAPPRLTERMRAAIPGAELVSMPGQGHSFYSAVPDQCLDLVFGFYRRLGLPLPDRA
jgi:3-oxoadipate enol-lactonase